MTIETVKTGSQAVKKAHLYLALFSIVLSNCGNAEDVKIEVSKTNVASYQKESLSSDTKVELKKGEYIKVKLKDSNGKSVTYEKHGPYSDKKLEKKKVKKTFLQTILDLFAKRTFLASDVPDSYIDAMRDEDFCFTDPAEDLLLWRADTDTKQDVWLQKNADAEPIGLRWSVGEAALAWPLEEFPLSHDSEYFIAIAEPDTAVEDLSPRSLRFHKVPADLSESEQKTWNTAAGCLRQGIQALPSE